MSLLCIDQITVSSRHQANVALHSAFDCMRSSAWYVAVLLAMLHSHGHAASSAQVHACTRRSPATPVTQSGFQEALQGALLLQLHLHSV